MKNKKSVIQTITWRSFRNNKLRNLVAILAIILTTLMFTSLFILSLSMIKNQEKMNLKQVGTSSEISFKNLTNEEKEKIAAHPDLTGIGESVIVGIAENDEFVDRHTEIRYGDKAFAQYSFAYPQTGYLPQKEDEIATDTLTLDILGISHEIGQKVTLKWREDLTQEVYQEKVFILSGFWKGEEASAASMAWVSDIFREQYCKKFNQEEQRENNRISGMVYIAANVKGGQDLEETAIKIRKDTDLPDVQYGINWAFDSQIKLTRFMEVIPLLLGAILVFASGYLIIYNIFQISVASDIRFFGKLKTLGASAKQIRRILFGQSNLLCLIGIPIGLMSGYVMATGLVPFLLTQLDTQPEVFASPVVFAGAALFAYVTVLISCLKPARLASMVSPMEALRYQDASVSMKKKAKRSKNNASLSHMAFANLGRNKKRTIMVICSLTLGLVLLTCINAKNASFDINKYMQSMVISDFELKDSSLTGIRPQYNPQGTTLNKKLINQIEANNAVTETGHLYSQDVQISLGTNAYENIVQYYEAENGRILKEMEWDISWTKGYQKVKESRSCPASIFGIDGLITQVLASPQNILEGSIEEEQFNSGNYVIACGIESDKKGMIQPNYAVGEMVEIDGEQFEVMAIVKTLESLRNISFDENQAFSLTFYTSAEKFQKMYPDHTLRSYFFNIEEDHENEMETTLKEYKENVDKKLPITSKKTIEHSFREQTLANTVIAMAISIIIAFVGIINFINSMVTAIVSRHKEFAMIQSVGMTKKQLRKMLTFEGLYYAAITLLISYVIGSLAVGVGVRMMMAGDWTATFHFTIMPLVICTPILLFFAVLIPYICFKNIERQSLVERLRDTSV